MEIRPLKKRKVVGNTKNDLDKSKVVPILIEKKKAQRKLSDVKKATTKYGKALSWYPKISLPRSLKILRIDRLAKLITQNDFQSFQDHLIFLGIIQCGVVPDQASKAKNLSKIPLQFYAQLKGRFDSFAFLHLLTISFLNERIAFEFLEQFPFFKQKENNSTLELDISGERKSTEITITKSYTLRNVKISKAL